MKSLLKRVGQLAILAGLIWCFGPIVDVSAATKPTLVSLGQLRDGVITPTRLDLDAAGTLYVADSRRNAVLRFDKYGRTLPMLSGSYRIGGTGLAVTPDGSKLYVTIATSINSRGSRVITAVGILDAKTGELLGYLGSGAYEFQEAGELDLDNDGIIYVVDHITRIVKVFSPATGALLYQFGGYGTGQGQFWMVRSLSVDTYNKEVYVTDPTSNSGIVRVQVFALDGTFKRLIQQASFGTPTVCFPAGLAFDNNGRGYMLESYYSDLRLFASGPTFASFGVFGVFGYQQSQFSRPYDIVYDPDTKRLFVGNDGGRIEIFGVDGGSTPVKSNDAPGLPALLSPVAESEVVTASPTLEWQNASDPDGDNLVYNVKVLRDGQNVATYNNIASGAQTSTVQVAALEENSKYSWTAQAFDGEEVSAWNAAESFWVNAVQEAPSAPVLVAPAAETVLDGTGVFSWQAATDPDPFDTVGYRLEIAADAAFATPLISVELTGLQSPALKDLADYRKLNDGATCYWRVVAVDNHGEVSLAGESRSFVYDTTVLTVDATFPGAKVYLGGNHAYSGSYLGEVPLELRDLPAGSDSLVVERAGFESWVGRISVGERANVAIKAVLVPALQPEGLKARPLNAGGQKLQGGSEVVPFAVDYDRDGLIDLLTSDASGKLILYRGVEGEQPAFAAGIPQGLVLPAGAALFVSDWNNDSNQDLIVGTGSGGVQLYQGGVVTLLAAGNVSINVGASAVPVVFDYDNDGKKDLVVGSGAGAVFKYRNIGSDAAPELVADGSLVGAISGNAAPFVTDWNADGRKDLLIATSQHVFVCMRQADGSFAAQAVLTVEDDLVGKNGKSGNGSGYLGDKLRIYAIDADGKNGKDLIVGNAAGQVRLAASFGKAYVADFSAALEAKLALIVEAAQAQAPELLDDLAELAATLQAGQYAAARESAVALALVAPAEMAAALNDVVSAL